MAASPDLRSSTLGLEDSPSERARGAARVRRINLTIVASIVFRATLWLTSLIYVPLTVHYLGQGRFGLWVAVTSVMTLLAFSDCGIGYGLINHVVNGLSKGKRATVRASISSTFFVLAIVAVAGCLLFAAAWPLIPWTAVLRTSTAAETSEASRTVAVIVVTFLLTLPFTTVQRVQSAVQRGYESQLWETGGVLFSFLGLVVAIRMHAGLAALAIVFAFGPLVALVLNWLVYFGVRERAYLPSLRMVRVKLAAEIVRDGGYFLILQIAAVLVFATDAFIVLHYFGQAELGEYTLVAKLFQVMPALAAVGFAALWPAYTECLARGDHAWVRRILVRSAVGGGLACAAVSVGIAFLVRPVVLLWTGSSVHPSVLLLSGFVVFSSIAVMVSAVGAFLSSVNFIRGQAVWIGLHAVVSVVLRIMFCKYWGVAGAVWGSSLAYLTIVVPAYAVLVPKMIYHHAAGGAGTADGR